jgi:hypothetical protein
MAESRQKHDAWMGLSADFVAISRWRRIFLARSCFSVRIRHPHKPCKPHTLLIRVSRRGELLSSPISFRRNCSATFYWPYPRGSAPKACRRGCIHSSRSIRLRLCLSSIPRLRAQIYPSGSPCYTSTRPRVWLKWQPKVALPDLPDRTCGLREQLYDLLQRVPLPLEPLQFAQTRRERYPFA